MKHILAVAVAIGLVWSFAPSRGPATPVVVQPTGSVSKAMAGATRQDKARVSAFYASLADVVERDEKVIPTVGAFTTLHSRSLDLAFKGTDLPGKYKGLDKAINDQLVAAVGTDDVPLPPAKRLSLVQALKDVANAAR